MIKLRTTLDADEPMMSVRYEWPRQTSNLVHDTLICHALVDAMGEELPELMERVEQRAAELLKEWGVE